MMLPSGGDGAVTSITTGGSGGGGGGPIRHAVGAQQNRAAINKRSRDFGSIEPNASAALNGMNAMSLNPSPMGGMAGLPGMNANSNNGNNGVNGGNGRLGWGGMVEASPGMNPYGVPEHQYHHQPHHGFQHPYPGQHMPHLQHHRIGPQGGRFGVPNGPMGGIAGMGGMGGLGGMGGMTGMNGMNSMNNFHGGIPGMGPMSKKKMKVVAPVVKDKNCPKRPRNSYIFFTLMKRDDIKKKHPEFKPTEITKMLGEEWQKLSESEKESYGSMAENDKKRYQSEMEAYDASNAGGVAIPGGARNIDNMGWGM
ncbi:High mobility group protein 20A [Entomortierella chlamydospora]|nr:High mobility group protein 20A [Entomortierella chlamydospora]